LVETLKKNIGNVFNCIVGIKKYFPTATKKDQKPLKIVRQRQMQKHSIYKNQRQEDMMGKNIYIYIYMHMVGKLLIRTSPIEVLIGS
jgi:hypothetical protein